MAKEKGANKVLTLDEALNEINKGWGGNAIHRGIGVDDYKRIPFTSPRLNYITHGGLPRGKLIEFYGSEHSGKTTTALDSVANYQTLDDAKEVLWVDPEFALDEVWAGKMHVDVDSLFLMQPDTQSAEEIFDNTLTLMRTGRFGLVVIDSFGVMQSAKAYDESVADKNYGGIAQALTKFSSKALVLAHKHDCTVIGLNQLRDKMNSTYGGTTTVGGRGWRHDTTVRLEFSKGYSFDDKYNKLSLDAEHPCGNIVNVAMTKNRTCAPNRKNGYYTLRYDIGIDYMHDLIDVCMKYDVIVQKGSWYVLKDTTTGADIKSLQGQYQAAEFLSDENNIEILKMYEDFLDTKIKED